MEMSKPLRIGLLVVGTAAGALGGYTFYIDRSLEFGTPSLTLFIAAALCIILFVLGTVLRKDEAVIYEREHRVPREARNSTVPTSMPYAAADRSAPMIGDAATTRPTKRLNTTQRKRQTRSSVPLPKPLPRPDENQNYG
jgi:hypothetical protein